ncbi:MAG: 4Fe-4S binding protein [Promethearchaeota archaeon]
MTEVDYYEIVRQKLSLGPLYAPKHKKINELLRILWNEEEIKILSFFKDADHYNSLEELEERAGIPKEEFKSILDNSYAKGTIARIETEMGFLYSLIPLLPGIFEKYFIRRNDTDENIKKVAEIYKNFVFKEFLPPLMVESDLKFFRPRLPSDAKEKLIEIDKSIDVESQVLPYELVSQLIDKYDIFTVIPCQCRLIGEYSGDLCEVAPTEMGCFLAGVGALSSIERGSPKLNKEEALEYFKKTEKAGLIHNTVADSSIDSTLFVCNCCSCHCGALRAKDRRYLATMVSNYLPKINNEICTKCETCLKKCPMGAIYHKFPNELDSTDERMFIDEDDCLGCGVCATNCPNNAIKLVKVRDNIPTEKFKIGSKTLLELI